MYKQENVSLKELRVKFRLRIETESGELHQGFYIWTSNNLWVETICKPPICTVNHGQSLLVKMTLGETI